MEQEKKYLKTIEEVSDALASGKVIHNKYETKIWKDKNGFIVSETKDGSQFLNDYMFTQDDEPYTLEPKPLEVKKWHLYENTKGRRVLIFHKDNTNLYPFSGVLLTETGYYDCDYFSNNGKSCHIDKRNLVKEIADLSQYFEKEKENGENS